MTWICSSIYRRNRCLERIRKAKNCLHILKRQLVRRRVVFAASFLPRIPCVRLLSLQSDGFGLFRGRKRPNIHTYMLYANCICCMHVQPLVRYRFSLHCEPVLRRTVPAQFHGVRLCLHYPVFHAITCQNCSSAHFFLIETLAYQYSSLSPLPLSLSHHLPLPLCLPPSFFLCVGSTQ